MYSAVLFNADNEQQALNKSTMTEPLLQCDVNDHGDMSNKEQASFSVSTCRVKALSLVTGSIAAIVSQLALTKFLWYDAILHESTGHIVLFSVVWSFWTCNIVFGIMMLLVNAIGRAYKRGMSENDWQDLAFQMEAHHVVGALLSISTTWMLQRVTQFKILPHSSTLHTIVFLLLLLGGYVIFFSMMTARTKVQVNPGERENSMMSTYQLVAGTLGLIIGLCSQFMLSFFLWRSNVDSSSFGNIYVMSMLWSCCTVVITFTGCTTLRLLVSDESDTTMAARIFLRMEAHYVFCSLIGICLSWIYMDLVLDLVEQILPSVVMLLVSLCLFGMILRCFPEEECLAELEVEAAAAAAAAATEERV
jgi:hypothetical protein